ncbi:PucR family transcriptional regulator [Williamsia sp. 1135]|uniref:PucR family transcriptional regulator n=1 Tax=Williamsia sp. 1135 TaxID=1889262 RepID=UPI000A10A72F|nr:PucR family transcriptional regulator [Williamsia sp. 1135]ORM38116.1 PucR family transcriptional regulator [Williamsia sp. 1135]
MQPTIAEVLALPVVRAGKPEMITDGPLDRPVRWVHVSDLADLSDLLEGGELVLTTGRALADPATREGYLDGLVAAGAVGLIIELGVHIDQVPRSVTVAGRALDFPVIALHQQIRFVQLTEQVHRIIVADQYGELEFARTAHETFTGLSMRRASVDEIVTAAAQMLEAPVVLEDLNRQVVSFAGTDAASLLTDWDRRSRLTPEIRTGDDHDRAAWLARPVGVQPQTWGRLIAPHSHVADNRSIVIIERAAQAIALNRMTEQDRSSLELRAQGGLVDLRHNRIHAEADASARAFALGLAPASTYVAMTIRLRDAPSTDQLLVQQRRARIVDAVTHAIKASRNTALTSASEGGRRIDVVLSRRPATAGRSGPDPLTEVCTAIRHAINRIEGVTRCAIGVGPDGTQIVDTAVGLAESGHVAEVALALPDDRPFHRSSDTRLRGLIALIRDDPRVQAFAETELRALLEHRAKYGDELFTLLRRFLELGGNKTDLAAAVKLSRPTLYARLDTLSRVLGADLSDAESRTSLHTAVLIIDAR